MNALERYFAETGENAHKLAERIGCAASTITRPLKGERNVSLDFAISIEKATAGRVTAEDFVSICLAAKKRASGEAHAEQVSP
ncbi:hypothetical protein ACQVP2_07650 [Methylobacterium aquaticum]|uniref:hypothetical protein n=1 Tax=Methylobacterium aquaticum TaxID=270351 RepID=UPI003D167534